MESAADIAERWQMGPEARALVILTGVLLAFGLATVYSASAIVEMQAGYGHAHLLVRQLLGMGVGVVLGLLTISSYNSLRAMPVALREKRSLAIWRAF